MRVHALHVRISAQRHTRKPILSGRVERVRLREERRRVERRRPRENDLRRLMISPPFYLTL